jgi:hypothetical protein
MTFSEVLRDWEELSLAGRFSFLLRIYEAGISRG